MSTPDPIERERPRPAWIPTRVFISGASGFVGRSLAARYKQLGSEVRGVDKVADPKEGVVAGNTAQAGTWQEHAQDCDLFIHAAAIVSFTHDPQKARKMLGFVPRISINEGMKRTEQWLREEGFVS